MEISIIDYVPKHQVAIRQILERIGWAEQYIAAAEWNAEAFSQNRDAYGVYIATVGELMVGFIYGQSS